MPDNQQTQNLALIDILRGLAALAVLLYHASIVSFFPEDNHPYFSGNASEYLDRLGLLNSLVFFLTGFGYLGVSLFFVISGFCIHLPYIAPKKYEDRGGLSNFSSRRFWRIYPPYIFVTCISFILAGVILQKHGEYNISFSYLIDHLWFWHYDPKAPTNMGIVAVSWTVALEVFFYIIYALLGRKLIIQFGIKPVAITWFLIHVIYTIWFSLPLSWNTLSHPIFSPSRFPITRFGEWMLGAWIAEWWVSRIKSAEFKLSPRLSVWSIVGILLLFSILLVGWFTNVARDLASDLLAAVGFACLVRGLLESARSKYGSATNLLIKAGLISYSLYLVHIPVFAAVKIVAAPNPGGSFFYNFCWIGFSCLLAIVTAFLTYVFVESPAHALGKHGRYVVPFTKNSLVVGRSAGLAILMLFIGFTAWASTMIHRRIVTFTSPTDKAFFQKASNDLTPIHISGHAGVLAGSIEWSSSHIGSNLGSRAWTRLTQADSLTGFYEGDVKLPPGHHVIWLRTKSSGKSWRSDPREIYVGDLFLILGQSNAAGYSATMGVSPSSGVRLLNQKDGSSRIAHDPQTADGGGSPWPGCGQKLEKALGYPVGFINLAQGGAPISSLSNHYWLGKNINSANWGGQKVRAALWCQGESDSTTSKTTYEQSLTAIVDYTLSRNLFSDDPTWIVATTSWNGFTISGAVRDAQIQVVAENPVVFPGPDTDKITPIGRELDRVHFTYDSSTGLAEEWADFILRALKEE
jgi:peptidoglycan/LPS O-acetylase OafA/YrhL